MPEYSAPTARSENIYKYIEPTNQIELERNTPVTSFVSNIVGKSSVDNNSKDARLNPKICDSIDGEELHLICEFSKKCASQWKVILMPLLSLFPCFVF